MRCIVSKLYAVLIAVVFICCVSYSQNNVGKIYPKDEANLLFGPAVTVVSIPTVQLNNLTSQSSNYLMFRIFNGNLTILGDNRLVLFPANSVVNPQDVFEYFSISLIRQLISDGNSTVTFVEVRNNGIVTLTSGDYTLETGAFCPPYCY